MFKNILLYWLLMAFFLGMNQQSFSQVSPEIQLGARGVMSFNVDYSKAKNASAVNDFSDSSTLIGFRQKLYSQYRGQMIIGFQFPDAESDLGQVFFHQMFLKVENKSNLVKIGRSRAISNLIEFPTLRDDDALRFTDVLNPFSSGDNSEDSQYGNVLEIAHLFGQRYWFRIHGEHFSQTPIPPATSETDFSLNSIGFSFQYRVPGSQRWNREILEQIGVNLNAFLTDHTGYSNELDKALKNVIFSVILNIKPDPVHFWDIRYQTIYNLGFSEIKQIIDYTTLTRAESLASFTSLRYLYRKFERPTVQLTFAFGYKSFLNLSNTTNEIQFVTNGFYRLGENFDIGLQYQYEIVRGDLKTIYYENESKIRLALVFSVDQLWNSQFDDRESLLNLEHGYIP